MFKHTEKLIFLKNGIIYYNLYQNFTISELWHSYRQLHFKLCYIGVAK